MNIDLLKSPDQNILDLVIAKNVGLVMTLSQVAVGVAAALVDDPSARNTEVTLTATANAGFSGSRVIKYNRLGLDSGVVSLPSAVNINPADDVPTIKTKLATALGLMESELDFTFGGDTLEVAESTTPGILIPENEDDTSKVIVVAAKSASKLYVGTALNVQLTVPDTDIPLASAIEFDVMDGFDAVVA